MDNQPPSEPNAPQPPTTPPPSGPPTEPQPQPPTEPQPPEKKPGGYGKRPLWQWIALYVVIGAIVYGLIYYFFMSGQSAGTGY